MSGSKQFIAKKSFEKAWAKLNTGEDINSWVRNQWNENIPAHSGTILNFNGGICGGGGAAGGGAQSSESSEKNGFIY